MAFEREWNCIFCSGCEEGGYLGLLPMERNVPAVADLAVNDGRSETCPWKRYGLDFWIFKGEMGEDIHFFFLEYGRTKNGFLSTSTSVY